MSAAAKSTADNQWPNFRKTLAGPGWRQACAVELQFGAGDREVDPQVQRLYLYRRDVQQDPQGTAARQPLLAAVEAVQQNPHLVEALQLLVLADATCAQISERTSLPEDVISLWQALYFDVGEYRHVRVWMHEIVARAGQESPRLASRMRLAIGGGLLAVDDLLRAETETPPAEADQHRQRRLRLLVRVDEALDQPAQTPAQHLAIVKLHLQLRAADQRNELQRLEQERRLLQTQERQREAALTQEIAQQPRPARAQRPLPSSGLSALRWGGAAEVSPGNNQRGELPSVLPVNTSPRELTTQNAQPGDVLPYTKSADDENYQPESNASFAA